MVNDEAVLRENLAASPAVMAEPERLTLLRDQPSASIAYNAGLDATTARICVFAHQDVYLPLGWEERLKDCVAQLDRLDPNWAVAGLFGMDLAGTHVGWVWDGSQGKELGGSFETPIEVHSIDELLIILNREANLFFDSNLPSFHMYGTDIVQTARAAGHGTFIISAPVIHNSIPVAGLHGDFMRSYDYMRRKWWQNLPIKTPVTKITKSGFAARWKDFRRYQVNFPNRRKINMARIAKRPDPKKIARRMGYE